MPDPDLLGALRRHCPDGAGCGSADPQVLYPLMPGEDLPNAVPRRRAEFSAGRSAARMALAELGLPAVAIPAAADRAPVWPEGVVGSITHSRTACLAIAARSDGCRGIGVDIEPATALQRGLWKQILLPQEQRDLAGFPADQAGVMAKTIFSAKEAAYKAQYRQSRKLIGFDAMQVTLHGNQFSAVFTCPCGPFSTGDRIGGHWVIADGHILTLAFL